MTSLKPKAIASYPRWDGSRVLFEVVDGDRSIACAISRNALQDLSPHRRFAPAELLKCFAAQSDRIEAIALAKLRARRHGMPGLLQIWSDDIDDPPPTSAPAAVARQAKVPRAKA